MPVRSIAASCRAAIWSSSAPVGGTADHVGVYVGNGKFIQSPRTGRDIQITSLSEDYWIRHYVGARRVMTPKPFAEPDLPRLRQVNLSL